MAGGTAALLVARLRFLRAFGPALAITVLVTLMVAVTFVPAALAMFGKLVYWPTRPSLPPAEIEIEQGRGWRGWLARLTTSKPVAAAIAAGAVALLLAAALGLSHIRLGFSLTGGLPNDDPVKRATEAAAQGFAPGIVSPTMILLEGHGLAGREVQLSRLNRHPPGEHDLCCRMEAHTGGKPIAVSHEAMTLTEAIHAASAKLGRAVHMAFSRQKSKDAEAAAAKDDGGPAPEGLGHLGSS